MGSSLLPNLLNRIAAHSISPFSAVSSLSVDALIAPLEHCRGEVNFLQAITFYPVRFTMDDVEQLLRDLIADRPGISMECSTSFLASHIMTATGGHRGLVGVCLSELDMSLVRNGKQVTEKAWQGLMIRLPYLLSGGGVQVSGDRICSCHWLIGRPPVMSLPYGCRHTAAC